MVLAMTKKIMLVVLKLQLMMLVMKIMTKVITAVARCDDEDRDDSDAANLDDEGRQSRMTKDTHFIQKLRKKRM